MDGKYTIKELYDIRTGPELPIFEIQGILNKREMGLRGIIDEIGKKYAYKLIDAEIENENTNMPAYITIKLAVSEYK